MQQLIQQIEQWADDRNLIDGSTPQKQTLKLIEEIGELAGAIARNNIDTIRDSIGDCVVVTIILAKQTGVPIFPNQFSLANKLYQQALEEGPHLSTEQFLFHLNFSVSNYLGISEIDDITYLNAIFVTLYQLSLHLNIDFIECVRFAYNQIKDRKGKMIDGVFVKEGDL